jgi:hypothetical protein
MTTGEAKRSYYDYRAQRARVEALFKIEPPQLPHQSDFEKGVAGNRVSPVT